MIRRKLLMASAIIASGVSTACSDTTAPRNEARAVNASAAPVELTFTKWFTTPPFMTGITSYGEGTFAGQILKRTAFANGVVTEGAMVGSRVHVEFQVIKPCQIVVPEQPVCFQGTIRIQ